MKRIYMDYAATTPTHPDVVKAMIPYFTEIYGNPSSIHSCGLDAKKGVDAARQQLAEFIGAKIGRNSLHQWRHRIGQLRCQGRSLC